jgi:agmatine/peptidylarginine deiminase
MPMPSHCHDGTYDCPMTDYVSRSYMNVLSLNNELIVPVYNIDRKYEEEAINKWKTYTKKNIITIESEAIIKYNGIIHCITKTGPRINL